MREGLEAGTSGIFFGGLPGRRFIGVDSVGPFSVAGVETAVGRILDRPEVRLTFPENASKSLSDDDDR